MPRLLELLGPYLQGKAAECARTGKPTLPVTNAGKVNVTAVAGELGLGPTQRQHLYKPEVAAALDEAAAQQRIGCTRRGSAARPSDDGGLDALLASAREQVALAERRASEAMQMLAEREALVAAQRREIASLRERLRLRDATGMIMRGGAE